MAYLKRRPENQVNAGSMADIAFLLLIFFLVSTTIDIDEGILVNLPPLEKSFSRNNPYEKILNVKINAENRLMVEGELVSIKALKKLVKDFAVKNQHETTSPRVKSVVSIQNDRGTAYAAYIEVYNEIKAACHELWDEAAKREFQRDFDRLDEEKQNSIKSKFPFVISEAEPTDHE